jgi:tRNA threonylcarbamoyladenosine biosynthesis protein TsaB
MKILALEFSSSERSVAIVAGSRPRPAAESNLLSADKVASTPNIANQENAWKVAEVLESGASGANVIGMIEAALRQAQAEREQIEHLVVGLGPGSYNGVRLAIAVAQGWQLASGQEEIKLLGISSAECIAAQGMEEGLAGRVNVVIDAQRGEFYLAGYDIGPKAWSEVEPLRLVTLQEVERRDTAGERFMGPDVAARLRGGRRVFPRAATLGRLALGRTDFVDGEKLEPIYLRKAAFVKAPPPRQRLE